jgi:hypothetical protein
VADELVTHTLEFNESTISLPNSGPESVEILRRSPVASKILGLDAVISQNFAPVAASRPAPAPDMRRLHEAKVAAGEAWCSTHRELVAAEEAVIKAEAHLRDYDERLSTLDKIDAVQAEEAAAAILADERPRDACKTLEQRQQLTSIHSALVSAIAGLVADRETARRAAHHARRRVDTAVRRILEAEIERLRIQFEQYELAAAAMLHQIHVVNLVSFPSPDSVAGNPLRFDPATAGIVTNGPRVLALPDIAPPSARKRDEEIGAGWKRRYDELYMEALKGAAE